MNKVYVNTIECILILVINMGVFKSCVFMFVIFHGSMPLLAMKRNNETVDLFWNDNAYQQAIDLEKQRQYELDKALVEAVSDNDFEKVKELVGRGAKIGGVRKCGAIFFALVQFEPEILQFFVEKVGLDPNEYIIDSGGENEDEEIVSPLLVIVSSFNRPENLQYLLKRGAKVDVCDAKGITPLSSAVNNGRRESAKLLLDFGADPNLQPVDNKGVLMQDALSRAIEKNSCAMVQLLLFHGAFIRPEHSALAKNAKDECVQKIVSDEKLARVIETACCLGVPRPSSVLPEELKILLIQFLRAAPLKECERM